MLDTAEVVGSASMSDSALYYDVVEDDVNYSDRWFLGEPIASDGTQIDARHFVEGLRYSDGLKYIGPNPKVVPIDVPGRRVGFLFAAFDMPVVSRAVADIVACFGEPDIQRFPVLVDGHVDGYEILNIVSAVDCLDEARCEHVMKWTKNDHRPELAGKPRMIIGLRINPERAAGKHILRIANWRIALIVSDALRSAIEAVPDLGVRFLPVT